MSQQSDTPHNDDPAPAAIILAAGGSSRMGQPKQTLPFAGRPLLAHAVEACRGAGCGLIIVVLGRDAAACTAAVGEATDVVFVNNGEWQRGQGASLRCGVRRLLDLWAVDRSADPAACYLLLGDQPRVTAGVLRRLSEARDAARKAVAVSAYAGTVGPPLLVGVDALVRLRDWPDDRGAKELWTGDAHRVVRVDCPEAAEDVDTPADYARLLAGTAVTGQR